MEKQFLDYEGLSYFANKNLPRFAVMPTASADNENKQVFYTGETTASYTHNRFYECHEVTPETDPKTYEWVETDVQTIPETKPIQVDELPTASIEEFGNVYQYVGDDDNVNNLIHNYFYECVSDGASTPTYSWEQKDVQPSENPTQVNVLPTAAPEELGHVYQFIGISTADFTHDYFYECLASEVTPVGDEDPSSEGWYELVSGEYVLSSDDTVDGTKTYYEIKWEQVNVQPETDVPNIQVETMPVPSASELGKIYEYVGTTNTNYTNGYFYKCVSDGGDPATYSWVQTNTQPTIQVATLPTASAKELGKVYQYLGSTNLREFHGFFYECVSDGASTPTYSWKEVAPCVQVNYLPNYASDYWKYVGKVYQVMSTVTGGIVRTGQLGRFFKMGLTEHTGTSSTPKALHCYVYSGIGIGYALSTDETWDSSKTYYDASGWVEVDVQKPVRLYDIEDAQTTAKDKAIIGVGDIIIYCGQDTEIVDSDYNPKTFKYGHSYTIKIDRSGSTDKYWWEEVLISGNGSIPAVDTMPTASLDEYGNTYLYIGDTTVNYKHDGIYRCENDSSDLTLLVDGTMNAEKWETLIGECTEYVAENYTRYFPKREMYLVSSSSPYTGKVRFFTVVSGLNPYSVSVKYPSGSTDNIQVTFGTTKLTVYESAFVWKCLNDIPDNIVLTCDELPDPVDYETGTCMMLKDAQTGYTKGDIYKAQIAETIAYEDQQLNVGNYETLPCLRRASNPTYNVFWPVDGYTVYAKKTSDLAYKQVSRFQFDNSSPVISLTVYYTDNTTDLFATTYATTPTSVSIKYESNAWVSLNQAEGSPAVQVTTLPTASVDELGKVYQYVGATNANYTHNYFYECVSDEESTPTYSWQQKDVQPSLNPTQVTVLPTANADELGKVYQFVGTTDANYTNGYFYKCVSDGESTPTYSWEQLDTQPEKIIQVATLPTASATEVGKIYQYVGTTTSNYINGYFYHCISDGQNPETYSWEQKDVQPGGGESVKWVDELPTGSAIEDVVYATRGLQCVAGEEFVWKYTTANDPITYSSWPLKPKYTGKVYLYYNNTWNTVAEVNTRVTSGELVSLTFRSGSGSATNIATYNVGETFTIKITGDDTAFFYAGDSENGVLIQVDNKMYHFPTPSSALVGKIYQYIGDDDDANGFYNGLLYTCVSDEANSPTYYWIPTEEWIGTHSAWEALPQAIKNHYHQKKVNFTDEDTGNIETVVDAVTDGDMHAVTSNAVYDSTLAIKTITPTRTGAASNSGVWVYQIGKVVQVNFAALVSVDGSDTPSGTSLYTGFPKPALSTVRFSLNKAEAKDDTCALFQIDAYGTLKADGQGLSQSKAFWGSYTYLTN